jgi:hypothetical protein
MRDIIHIGYPRTASTWFQNNLFSKVQNYTFISRKTVQENLVHPLPERYDKKWAEEINTRDEPFLISEEMISGKIRAGSVNLHFLEIYAKRIKETFNDPIIIIFLRGQPDIIFSFYNLYIKKGGTFTFSKFIRQDLFLQEWLLFSKSFFCYDLPVQILANTFGRESVKIYIYEEFALNPKGFVHQFCNELNLKADLINIDFGKINSSYSPFQLKAKCLLNRFTSEGIPFKHYFFNVPFIYSCLKESHTAETKIPVNFLKQIDLFNEDFAISNNKLIHQFNLTDLNKYNYPL